VWLASVFTAFRVLLLFFREILARCDPRTTKVNALSRLHEMQAGSRWVVKPYTRYGKQMMRLTLLGANGEEVLNGTGSWTSSFVAKQTMAYRYLRRLEDTEDTHTQTRSEGITRSE
jgi:hypothetical protein